MPRNASLNADGFRVYEWTGGDTPLNRKYDAVEPATLLSVTSVKALAGEAFQLVSWKIANVVNLATGTRKVVRIGPRGGVKEVYVKDGEFPGEFAQRLADTDGREGDLQDLRRWLREGADQPRDIAAARGSVVHKLIELNLPESMVREGLVRQRFRMQFIEDGRKSPPEVTEDDVNFVVNAMRQYHDMRLHIPFIVLAAEPQVFNLDVGYAGSLDVLIWFLGDWVDGEFVSLPGLTQDRVDELGYRADRGYITLTDVNEIGGVLAIGDWKTSKDVYTSHVIQTTAYMAAKFVARDGLIDERLSELVQATTMGLVIQIRPNRWFAGLWTWREDIAQAFIGCAMYARFLAMHKKPGELFAHTIDGEAPDTEPSFEEED